MPRPWPDREWPEPRGWRAAAMHVELGAIVGIMLAGTAAIVWSWL